MRTLDSKSEYFNSLNDKTKALIRHFIVEMGYTNSSDLREHIIECGVAKKFSFTGKCLNVVIAHYEQSCS
ncbi:anti-restriction nuclease [Escherichia phage vB_EcoM_ESCO47]|nr:anti-restriction nuclease [Escherichia phage vB_EcoM_ESCO47]